MDGYFTTASPVTIYQMVDENLQVVLQWSRACNLSCYVGLKGFKPRLKIFKFHL